MTKENGENTTQTPPGITETQRPRPDTGGPTHGDTGTKAAERGPQPPDEGKPYPGPRPDLDYTTTRTDATRSTQSTKSRPTVHGPPSRSAQNAHDKGPPSLHSHTSPPKPPPHGTRHPKRVTGTSHWNWYGPLILRRSYAPPLPSYAKLCLSS